MSHLLPVRWVGQTIREVRELPEWARHDIGKDLNRVQRGLEPSSWAPMEQIGAGVREVKVKQGNNIARCVYLVAGQPVAVWVLHAFIKKDQRTPEKNKTIARQRLRVAIAAMKDHQR